MWFDQHDQHQGVFHAKFNCNAISRIWKEACCVCLWAVMDHMSWDKESLRVFWKVLGSPSMRASQWAWTAMNLSHKKTCNLLLIHPTCCRCICESRRSHNCPVDALRLVQHALHFIHVGEHTLDHWDQHVADEKWSSAWGSSCNIPTQTSSYLKRGKGWLLS